MRIGQAHLDDLRHRVANDLLLLVGVLSRQRSRLSVLTPDEIIDEAIGAVLSLAQFYRRMYEAGSEGLVDLPAHLEGIACGLRASYLNRLGIALSCSGEAISAPPSVARDIGLIVVELIANAAKHAFDEAGGSITVDLTECSRGVVCRVSDDGCGFSGEAMLKAGSGLTGASRLASTLGGWVEAGRAATGGATFELVIPRRAPTVAEPL